MSEVLLASLQDEIEPEDPNEVPEIPCYSVHSAELSKIVAYCEHYGFQREPDHIPIPVPQTGIEEWADAYEVNMLRDLSLEQLTKLLNAANFLNIPAIFELCCAQLASIFKNKNYNKLKKEIGTDKAEELMSSDLPKYTSQMDKELIEKYPWILENLAIEVKEANDQKEEQKDA